MISNYHTKSFLFIIIIFCFYLIACSSTADPVYGKYKMFSNDPAVNRFISNEDNYIQLNKDQTIMYNSTINGKPKFNFKGEYTYDKTSKTLTIKWLEGKLPGKLSIEVTGKNHIIRIGDTYYKKEMSK